MATSTPIDRLMQTVRMEIPGAPDETIKLVTFNVLDEFFKRTTAWRLNDSITLIENETEYDLGVPVNSRIVLVISVSHNGVQIAPAAAQGQTIASLGTIIPELTFPDADAQFAPIQTDLVGGAFTYALFRPDYLSIANPPTVEQRNFPLKALFALSLHRDALEIDPGDWVLDDWMYDMFFDDWLSGIRSTLYGMPNKPWSNAQLAIVHGKKFRVAMAQRKAQANKGFTYGQAGWRFPKFA